MEGSSKLKPPLGVKPRKFFIMDRIKDLSRAIYDRTSNNLFSEPVLLKEWSTELKDLSEELIIIESTEDRR